MLGWGKFEKCCVAKTEILKERQTEKRSGRIKMAEAFTFQHRSKLHEIFSQFAS